MSVTMLVMFLLFFPWIWSLIHCIRNPRLSYNMRIIGVIIIVVLGIIGSIIYLFLPRDYNPAR
ncbi:MAG: PLDc N-terminal domain-containing protein [Spirochaetales bacterium]|jgi:hypothetical protein|nr:PLDc N-terminal domain-containing protein [Spirochaetales bacterium]